MKVLRAADSSTWLKRRSARKPETAGGDHWCVVWPEADRGQEQLAACLAEVTSWTAGGIVLERPGMPREQAATDLCSFRQSHGYATSSEDIQLGAAPGHLFDETETANKESVRRLLVLMMSGDLEGTLANKSGRLIAVFGCGVIDFYVRDKSLAGRLRNAIRELGLR